MPLEIKTQGSKENGWRYSPKEGQAEVLDLIADKLPQLVIEDKPSAVWWRAFNKTEEAAVIAVLKENQLYLNDKEFNEQIALAEEIINEG